MAVLKPGDVNLKGTNDRINGGFNSVVIVSGAQPLKLGAQCRTAGSGSTGGRTHVSAFIPRRIFSLRGNQGRAKTAFANTVVPK
jgi:hypothetical protein